MRPIRTAAELDRAVDKCYRGTKFESDRERVEFLFQLCEKLATPRTIELKESKRRGGKRK